MKIKIILLLLINLIYIAKVSDTNKSLVLPLKHYIKFQIETQNKKGPFVLTCPCKKGILWLRGDGAWGWTPYVESEIQFIRQPALNLKKQLSHAVMLLCVPGKGVLMGKPELQKDVEEDKLPQTAILTPRPKVWVRCSTRQSQDLNNMLEAATEANDTFEPAWTPDSISTRFPWAAWSYTAWLKKDDDWYEWDPATLEIRPAKWLDAWLDQNQESQEGGPILAAPLSTPRRNMKRVWRVLSTGQIVRAYVTNGKPSRIAIEAWRWSKQDWEKSCTLTLDMPPAKKDFFKGKPQIDFWNFYHHPIVGERLDRIAVTYRLLEEHTISVGRNERFEIPAIEMRFSDWLDFLDLKKCRSLYRTQNLLEQTVLEDIRISELLPRMLFLIYRDFWFFFRMTPHITYIILEISDLTFK